MLFFELLYLLSAMALAAYGFNSILHCWLFWHWRQKESIDREESSLTKEPLAALVGDPSQCFPAMTVQLPIYNERHVASRLIEAVLALDWPANRLQIQVLDDSTDDTTSLIASAVARYRRSEIDIEHIRRTRRTGYKAGALAYGMESAKGSYIAIFDADFVPPPDFLRRVMPTFDDDSVGCVQARWGHVNPDTSLLTKAQALGIDGHFHIEQFVRHKVGAFLNFNGTAGVWRRSCMEHAGGWEHDTLTEDLDLSYRAQLAGWRIAYRRDLPVPAELPVQVDAFKRQQFRWAKGSLQTAVKLIGKLWAADEPRWRKALGTLHLTNYLVHPFMVLNLLLLLPISASQSPMLHVAPFLTTAAIGPPLMYWLAMGDRPISFWRKLQQLVILMALGTGLSLNNTKAAIEAFTGIDSEFKRTPKFAIEETPSTTAATRPAWHESTYALPRNPMVWLEMLFALYATYLFFYCLQIGVWWILFWVLMYAIGYGYIAAVAFYQSWQVRYAKAALRVKGSPST